jgi:alkanesulfonate monooxygenase SsuD/methylene tetrahydromethanopterin reductase-like flavin-dependent oxidoreductase (luciferase family)
VPEHPAIPKQYQSKYPLREDGKAPEFYGHIADPFVTLSAAAPVTTKIKLATGVCLCHNPVPILQRGTAPVFYFTPLR